MEIAHLGSGICWYKWRITGAILFDTRPAMMIRSDCRGDPRNTSAPKRAMSNRDALIDIISMAQQAKPNDMGQIEFLRAQFTALSKVVNTKPSEAAAAALATVSLSRRSNSSTGPLAKGASISSILYCPGIPVARAALCAPGSGWPFGSGVMGGCRLIGGGRGLRKVAEHLARNVAPDAVKAEDLREHKIATVLLGGAPKNAPSIGISLIKPHFLLAFEAVLAVAVQIGDAAGNRAFESSL